MNKVKIFNIRISGCMFHYAHFLCDCLFTEIINDIYKYNIVVREKNLNQTIGNFYKIYEDVMNVKNIELDKKSYDDLKVDMIIPQEKEKYSIEDFHKFRNFIFKRYNINNSVYLSNYPEVILIKRYDRMQLIDDESLKKINKNVTSGKERREIKDIDKLELHLSTKYNDKFKSLYLEFISFEEQVKYFNNAKLIICANGAAMSNLFFCKEGTNIIEVTCNKEWDFFNTISKNLNLNHVKCRENNLNKIIKYINSINILNNKKYSWENSSIEFLENGQMNAFGKGKYIMLDIYNFKANFGGREHNIVFNSEYTEFTSTRKDDKYIVKGSLLTNL